jgi:drug/metabolite transporter (DMT)-like permease
MKNIFLWIALALIWSSSYLAIKIGVENITPLTLVAMRMVIGTSVMLVVLRLWSLSLPSDINSWSILLIVGMTGNIIPFSLISYGEIHIDSGLAALLMGVAPVVTVLIAPMIHPDEILNPKTIAGITLGFLGLIILIGPSALHGIGDHITGQLAVFGAALCYAFTTLFSRKYAKLPALVMATGSMLIGTIIIINLAFIIDLPTLNQFSLNRSMLAAIYLGLFPTALATLIYFYLVPRLGAGRMSQVNFVVPIAGTMIGIVFYNEPLKLNATIAMALILLAVFLVTHRKTPERLIRSSQTDENTSN